MKRNFIVTIMMSAALLVSAGCQEEVRDRSQDKSSVPSVAVDGSGYPVNSGNVVAGNGAGTATANAGSPLQGRWVSNQCEQVNYFAPSNMMVSPVSTARQTATLIFDGGKVGTVEVIIDNYMDQICTPGSYAGMAKRLIGSYNINNALATRELIVTIVFDRCEGAACAPQDPFTQAYRLSKVGIRPLADGNFIEFGRFAPGGMFPPLFDTLTQYRRVQQ